MTEERAKPALFADTIDGASQIVCAMQHHSAPYFPTILTLAFTSIA
jgi:hypothetical protein